MDYPVLRRERLARLLPQEELDAFLVTNPVNVSYLTGFSGESSYLVLGRQRCLLVSDARFNTWIRGAQRFFAPATKSLPRFNTHYFPKPERRAG